MSSHSIQSPLQRCLRLLLGLLNQWINCSQHCWTSEKLRSAETKRQFWWTKTNKKPHLFVALHSQILVVKPLGCDGEWERSFAVVPARWRSHKNKGQLSAMSWFCLSGLPLRTSSLPGRLTPHERWGSRQRHRVTSGWAQRGRIHSWIKRPLGYLPLLNWRPATDLSQTLTGAKSGSIMPQTQLSKATHF